MNRVAEELMVRLRESLPESRILWEREPGPDGLAGSVLGVASRGKLLTVHFEQVATEGVTPGGGCGELPDLEGIVDDFVDFFEHSIYRKEKFTKLVPC